MLNAEQSESDFSEPQVSTTTLEQALLAQEHVVSYLQSASTVIGEHLSTGLAANFGKVVPVMTIFFEVSSNLNPVTSPFVST